MNRPPLHVVLVDDNNDFLESAAAYINSNSNEQISVVGKALSGLEAVDITQKLKPDLVLLDVAMPEMSGWETISRIKSLPNPARVIILTLFDSPEYRSKSKAVGAEGFLSKSAFGDEVIDMILRVCERDVPAE